ncbi:hypothetical protein DV515_00000728 [Chloebia gouldiae]|uniref:Uncharacterized protein n=1 Tax=Chloebia gouldiae TaxID=44316 RepID=A0A3L8SZY8_CHLGU|nr:hypothetical protein DV515_00000728 [Chloebia gouldiae]
MILCESNIIQKHNEEGGKEILEVGGSVAFANMAQKRMELGNGSQRSPEHLGKDEVGAKCTGRKCVSCSIREQRSKLRREMSLRSAPDKMIAGISCFYGNCSPMNQKTV